METENVINKKNNIILVLKESLKIGKESNYTYNNMYEKHKYVSMINKITTTINDKIKLFENIDENSYTFSRILETAKLALNKLQYDEGYNYYSAELILHFKDLEEIFKRRLKPIGYKIIEKEFIQQKIVLIKDDEIDVIHENEIDHSEYIEEDLTGKELVKKDKNKKEISELLKTNNFEY